MDCGCGGHTTNAHSWFQCGGHADRNWGWPALQSTVGSIMRFLGCPFGASTPQATQVAPLRKTGGRGWSRGGSFFSCNGLTSAFSFQEPPVPAGAEAWELGNTGNLLAPWERTVPPMSKSTDRVCWVGGRGTPGAGKHSVLPSRPREAIATADSALGSTRVNEHALSALDPMAGQGEGGDGPGLVSACLEGPLRMRSH